MSSFRPKAPKERPVRVPTSVARDLVRRGKRDGFLEARSLPFWRRIRVALRIVRGLTEAERLVMQAPPDVADALIPETP